MRISSIWAGLVAIALSSGGLVAKEPAAPPNWPVPRYVLVAPASSEEPSVDETEKRLAFEKAVPTEASSFVGVTPCRTVDTRPGQGFSGAYGPPSLNSTARDFVLTGRCGVPANAVAVSLNVTVVAPNADGFLTLFPTAGTVPTVSTLNFRAGQVLANAAIVPLGTGGAVTLFTNSATADLLIDVNGYFAPPPTTQKMCAVNYHGNWLHAIPVPATWTASTCNTYRTYWTTGSTSYYLGCVSDTGTSWGVANGGLPSPNCGW